MAKPKTIHTLTVRQYAALAGITIESVYRRLWNGRVAAKKISGRWYITLEKTR
jgi:hypothetical protein